MTHDKDADARQRARAQQAKGSVQEAIGKITGDIVVERDGLQKSRAGADKAAVRHPDTEAGSD